MTTVMTRPTVSPVSYRPPGKTPLTDWGRFIVRRRFELDWSATQAFEAVREGLNLGPKSRSAYLPFEYDREPDKATAALFERVFGGMPQDQDKAPAPAELPEVSDASSLVLALDRQTDAIRALVDAIARERAEGRDVVTAFDRAVEALLSGRQPVDSEASEGQRALRESAR